MERSSPQFLLNAFVDEGQTVYANSIGLEMDIRKDGFSAIPHITYADYNTGDILFRNGDANTIGNYSLVNSSMKALYVGVDLLWSARINKYLDFEYGGGVAAGVTFGDLEVNWVKKDTNGSLTDSKGNHYSACNTGDTAPGCNPADHQDTNQNPKNPTRTGHYNEPAWTSGGKKPSVLPNLSIPEIGLRFHPIKEFEARFGIGISPYGLFLHLSGNYGLPIGDGAKSGAAIAPGK